MIAFHEQHLGDTQSIVLHFLVGADDCLPIGSRKGASRALATIHEHSTEFAAAMWRITGPVAKMRNINTRCSSCFDNGLAVVERYDLAIYRQCAAHINSPLGLNGRLDRHVRPYGEPRSRSHPD